VPAVIRWPGVLEAGSASNQVFTVLDLLPTLTAAAGFEPGNVKPLDGENIWPSIRDGKAAPREGIVIGLKDLAVLDGPWKLHQSGEESKLYNLEDDPTEKHDLAAAHPEVVKRLKAVQEPFAKLIASRRPSPEGAERRPEGARAKKDRPVRERPKKRPR